MARYDSLYLTRHLDVEDEARAAYLDGFAAGVATASEAIGRAIFSALVRPEGHGGPDLDEHARAVARRLYREHLGLEVALRTHDERPDGRVPLLAARDDAHPAGRPSGRLTQNEVSA